MAKAVRWTQEQLAEIARLQEQRNLTVKGAKQYYARQQKKTAVVAGKAAPAKAARRVSAEDNPYHAVKTEGMTLASTDALPEATVLRMWKEGATLTAIAKKIGTGERPDAPGTYRVGRIRGLLKRNKVYPRKGKK